MFDGDRDNVIVTKIWFVCSPLVTGIAAYTRFYYWVYYTRNISGKREKKKKRHHIGDLSPPVVSNSCVGNARFLHAFSSPVIIFPLFIESTRRPNRIRCFFFFT